MSHLTSPDWHELVPSIAGYPAGNGCRYVWQFRGPARRATGQKQMVPAAPIGTPGVAAC
ncbi:hypothetical protein BDP81DRAFT_416421 [Colletotrichum phormii]|uniref:Uncharacterized protein n=1 Tax=Colletotrichum phormii TaxID=359342 RepID=A0AAJ0EKN1_9PEZI|nr:uncharacterized protein BDP81DRAFT_416421 [Colletotrichum phormii]KAK1654752.1 hypothetical protein BDP81DRAFT_416421 [Colletotrichum phormii]